MFTQRLRLWTAATLVMLGLYICASSHFFMGQTLNSSFSMLSLFFSVYVNRRRPAWMHRPDSIGRDKNSIGRSKNSIGHDASSRPMEFFFCWSR
jgi:hypothetical protein